MVSVSPSQGAEGFSAFGILKRFFVNAGQSTGSFLGKLTQKAESGSYFWVESEPEFHSILRVTSTVLSYCPSTSHRCRCVDVCIHLRVTYCNGEDSASVLRMYGDAIHTWRVGPVLLEGHMICRCRPRMLCWLLFSTALGVFLILRSGIFQGDHNQALLWSPWPLSPAPGIDHAQIRYLDIDRLP